MRRQNKLGLGLLCAAVGSLAVLTGLSASGGEQKKEEPKKEEPKKDDAVKADLEKLNGKWVAVSGEMNGQAILNRVLDGYTLAFSGDSCDFHQGNAPFVKRTFKIDPTKGPKTLDLVLADGAEKGKTNLAIYQFDGEILRICMARFDMARPSAFATKGITGVTILAFKKEGGNTTGTEPKK